MRGLALSGGGIKAAAHIGALKAFEEKNIKDMRRTVLLCGKLNQYLCKNQSNKSKLFA